MNEPDPSAPPSRLLATTERMGSGGADRRFFGFGAPGPELGGLLADRDGFAVIVDPAPLGPQGAAFDLASPAFANQAWLSDWPFSVAVGSGAGAADGYSTVLILKNRTGRLIDLAAAPEGWTSPSTFAGTETGRLSAWLTAFIAEACAKAGTDPLYRHFDHIAADPDWTGALVLRPAIDLADLPPELSVIFEGSGLPAHAHHLVLTDSPIGEDPAYPDIRALIDFDSGPIAAWESPLALRSLRALIEHRSIVYFKAGLEWLPRIEVAPETAADPRASLTVSHRFTGGPPLYSAAPLTPPAEALPFDRETDPAQPLTAWLETLFAPLAARWPSPHGISLDILHRTDLGSGGLSLDTPALTVPLHSEGHSALPSRIAQALTGWHSEYGPSEADGGAFLFRIRLYAPGSTAPCIRLPDVTLSLAKVADFSAGTLP